MKHIFSFLIIFSFFSNNLFSQEDEFQLTNFQDQTIPASPTTASLGSYAYAPVDLVSGALNISIPIWELKGNNLSLPISLSYRPGVKIEDTSEYTGHGWSLFAGGVITRSVQGEIDPFPRMDLTDPLTYNEAISVISHVYDVAPDVFNYNFMGYNGQFALENDLVTPYYIGDQRNWKMSYELTDNNISKIIIKTEDGTTYIFSEVETTDVEIDNGLVINHDVPVAWHLTEIISSSTNETIELTYYPEWFTYPTQKNNSLQLTQAVNSALFVPQVDKYFNFSSKKIDDIILYKNNTAVSKVNFEATTPRSDNTLGTAHALSRISIYNDLQNSQPLKYFDFDIETVNNERLFLNSIQEFSGDGNSFKPPHLFEYINPSDLPGRLEYKADHWGYYSSNGTEFPYVDKFKWRQVKTKEPTYHAKYGSLRKITFPTGGSNIFSYGLNEYHEEDWDYRSEKLELRWANTNWRTTDGSSTFSNFESNSFSTTQDQYAKIDFCLQLNKDSVSDWGTLQNEADEYEILVTNTETGENVFRASFDGSGDPEEIDMLVRGNHVTVKDAYQHLYETPNDAPDSSFLDFYDNAIITANHNHLSNGYAYQSYSNFPGKFGECANRHLYINLPAGNYVTSIKTLPTDNDMINYSSHVKLEIEYNTGNRINKKTKGGGIRIETQYIHNEDDEFTTFYSYDIHDENGIHTNKSSGQITEKPLLYLLTPFAQYTDYVQTFIGGSAGWFCAPHPSTLGVSYLYAKTGDVDFFPSAGAACWDVIETTERYTIQSKPYQIYNSTIAYSQVKEMKEDEVTLGYGFTLYKFNELLPNNSYSSHIDFAKAQFSEANLSPWQYGSDTRGWPFNGLLEISHIAKKPRSTLTYKLETATPVLVKEVNYEYNTFGKDRLFTASIESLFNSTITGLSSLKRRYSLLKSKETKLYNSSNNDFVTTKVEYEYDDGLYMPTKIITTDSENNKLIKRLKYSTEYTDINFGFGSSIGLADFKNKNIITPIEEQLWKNRGDNYYLIGGRLNIFDKVQATNANNELIQKSKLISYKSGNSLPYNTEYYDNNYNNIDWFSSTSINENISIINLNYYASGNLKEVSKEDGIPIIYIWGYNNMYPVAKIENASYEDIEALPSFGSDFIINGGLSAIQENQLRSQLPNALISTYTYNPLVGVTSTTDPKGYTMYYQYDELHRLKYIKDQDANILSKNDYNYTNQN